MTGSAAAVVVFEDMASIWARSCTRVNAANRAMSALSIVALSGIFVSMIRVVMVVLAVLALTWATGLLGDVLAGWAPRIVATVGPWGAFTCLFAFIAACYGYVFWSKRRHEQHIYATTGVIEIEKPHPWPMWLRVLPFVLPALGIVAAIVAAASSSPGHPGERLTSPAALVRRLLLPPLSREKRRRERVNLTGRRSTSPSRRHGIRHGCDRGVTRAARLHEKVRKLPVSSEVAFSAEQVGAAL